MTEVHSAQSRVRLTRLATPAPRAASGGPSKGPGDVARYREGDTRTATGRADSRVAPTESDRRAAPRGSVRAGDLARQADGRAAARRADAGRRATELYESMKGGIFGAGTDEERLFAALEGRSPEDIAEIRRSYRDHYGRDLDADVRDELSGEELDRAQAQLRGDQTAADASRLREAMDGAGTDEAAIHETLAGRSPEEAAALRRAYRARYDRDLDADLADELGGEDLDRAQAQLRGDTATAEAARLHDAIDGLGTDEATVMATLEGKTTEERAAIEAAYRREYGRDLRADLRGDLGGAELDRANALMEGRGADAAAAEIEAAMDGLGTDEAGIESVLEGKSDKERAEIARAYEQRYGRSLDDALASELSGDDLNRARSLADDGQLSAAERLFSAMDGAGTNEAEIEQMLAGRSAEEIDGIRADYRARYGRELDADLRSELSGRDLFDARMNLRGQPTSPEEALARMNERHDFERGDGNGVGNFVMDTFSDQGELLDRNAGRANQFYERAMADGRIDAGERARLSELTGFANADVGTYQDAKDSAADAAGTVAATAAGVAVVIGTAGTATPLVATVLGAAGAGAAARTVTTGLISGRAYGVEDAFSDAGMGAVDGLATATGMRAGAAVAQAGLRTTATTSLRRAGIEASERTVAHMSRQILAGSTRARVGFGALEGTVDGAIGGALGAGGTTALRDGTWDQGLGAGLQRMGEATALGGGLGALGGAAGGGLAGRNSTRLADDMIDALPPASAGGRAGVNEWDFVANGYRLEEIEGLRRGLLSRNDAGRVQRSLQDLGVNADREAIEAVKRYNFDSQGIAFDHRNYAAWNRLSQGRGTVADAQYLVHEMAEVRALQQVQRETGFDYLGRNFSEMTDRQARQWQSTFDTQYLATHRQALEAEYDYVARMVNEATGGRTRISRTAAAAADPMRAEARDWMLVDGLPMTQHRRWPQWAERARQPVDIGSRARQRLGFGRTETVTLADLVGRVRRMGVD